MSTLDSPQWGGEQMGGFSAAFGYSGGFVHRLSQTDGTGVIAWMLVGVFLFSGILKLRQPVLVAIAVMEFGVTRRVRPALGWALGIVELALATALVIAPRAGGVMAMILLWFFVVLIVHSLKAGSHFP